MSAPGMVEHPALDLKWYYLEPNREKTIYKGQELTIEHRGHMPPYFISTMNLGFINGHHRFNDGNLQRLIIRLVETVDKQYA
jgi:hypothetical protein